MSEFVEFTYVKPVSLFCFINSRNQTYRQMNSWISQPKFTELVSYSLNKIKFVCFSLPETAWS